MRKGSNTSNKFIAGLHKQSDIKKRVMNMFNEKYKNGILMALTLCLLSSITYFKIDLITPKSLFYQLLKHFQDNCLLKTKLIKNLHISLVFV